jgi:hypothetical protein
MVSDFTSIATFIIAGLALTSFALLRARALRAARAKATHSTSLLRDSAH